MTIPPIIANLPLFKALKGNGTDSAQSTEPTASAADNVEISTLVQERVGDVKTLSPEQATETASATAQLLADSDLALGLDPSFDK